MTQCRRTQVEMISSQLSLEALQHLENCAPCRARLCAEHSLTAALAATASHDGPQSPRTLQALLQTVEPQPQAAPPSRRVLLAAAALLLVATPALWFVLRAPDAESIPVAALEEAPERFTPFFVLDPLSPDLAAGRGTLVRARLPPSASIVFGLPIPTTEDALEADVLLGDDGAVYAVRLIY